MRFSMLLAGPGADDDGRRWVSAQRPPEQLAIAPPGVFVADPSGACLLRLDYRAPAEQWRAALAGVVGVDPPGWSGRGERGELLVIEEGLRAGRLDGARDALERWVESHPEDSDGAVWAALLLGVEAYRSGDGARARAHWLQIVQEHPGHPLCHRARYHLYDQETWPTRPHPDLLDVTALPSPSPRRSGEALPGAWRNALGMPFAPVPAGRFVMGGSPALLDRELPAHEVTLTRGFWMGATTVTRAQWAAFAGGAVGEGEASLPATGVSFAQADGFCAWLSAREGRRYRLPTEAEWERAARGGLEGAPYPWGAEPITEERCNFLGPRPVAVASYPPNGFGLHDMVGNVQEWTTDRYRERAYAERVERAAQGEEAVLVDPRGPETADGGLALRVVRGGQCGASVIQLFCRNSFRLGLFEEYAGGSIGLRVLLEGL